MNFHIFIHLIRLNKPLEKEKKPHIHFFNPISKKKKKIILQTIKPHIKKCLVKNINIIIFFK